ncbi:hypothetical protein Trydic_g1338 [Trypoxylus dichotomus]
MLQTRRQKPTLGWCGGHKLVKEQCNNRSNKFSGLHVFIVAALKVLPELTPLQKEAMTLTSSKGLKPEQLKEHLKCLENLISTV